MAGSQLHGTTVVIGGAGLAGLAAARHLEARGAAVIVAEPRDRVGGRVWTLRRGFSKRQHAEAGADLIEAEQSHVLRLASELGLTTTRIIRKGFGFYGPDAGGIRRIDSTGRAFKHVADALQPEIDDFNVSEHRWDSAVGRRLARMSAAGWLDRIGAPDHLRARVRGFRGFFLADPEELSLLPLVEQFAEWGTPGQDKTYRVTGGNDRLATGMARRLRAKVLLGRAVRRVRQSASGVVVTVEHEGSRAELAADYFVCAMPASTARHVRFEPGLPEAQHRAIAALNYGPATRLLLQFEKRFWGGIGRPSAYGTDLPTGAVWDGNEEQPGPAILSFLAGGRASRELQEILGREGEAGVIERIKWMGRPNRLLASQRITWDDDPWAGGGYAYFDPSFDPDWRPLLGRPAGRIVFAGEHTSTKWQGYMNGALETGMRAAAEISALAR